MRVLHVISCLVKADGHSQFCMTLAERLAAQGIEQRIFSLRSEDGEVLPDPKGLIHYASGRAMHLLNVSIHCGLEKQIAAIAYDFKPDVIHLHGGWHPVLFFCARVARRSGVPIVLSLHGSLRPAVIEGDRRIKKRLAWWLYQRRLVEMAEVIHVSTETEKGDLVRLGFNKPVVVIPNGADVREVRKSRGPKVLKLHGPKSQTRTKTVLCLGRLHPLKGLDLLIDAWKLVISDYPNWFLLLVGPDEQGTLKALREQVKRLGVVDSVAFSEPQYGEEKMRVMQNADLFVLSTRSENFGIVVAESLACGVPVITTKGAPWPELLGISGGAIAERDHEMANTPKRNAPNVINQLNQPTPAIGRCGWWIDIGVEPLVEALREAMSLTDEERREMGENGRRLVESKYQWASIAKAVTGVYDEILSHKR